MKHELSEEDQILRDALIAHRSAEMASAEAAKRKRRASKRVGTGEVVGARRCKVERAIPKPTGRRYKSVDALVRGECSKKFQRLFFALRRTQSGKRPNDKLCREVGRKDA